MTSQSQSGWTLWRGLPRALPYLRPYRKLASLSVTLMVLASVAALAQPWPLATMIDTISGHEPKTSALFFGHDDPYTILAITAAAGFFLVVVTHGLTVINSYVDTKIDQGMVLDLRSDLFQHCQRLSLTFHDDRQTGELMSRINQTAASLGAIVMAFPPIAQSLLTLVGMIVIAVLIDWQVDAHRSQRPSSHLLLPQPLRQANRASAAAGAEPRVAVALDRERGDEHAARHRLVRPRASRAPTLPRAGPDGRRCTGFPNGAADRLQPRGDGVHGGSGRRSSSTSAFALCSTAASPSAS